MPESCTSVARAGQGSGCGYSGLMPETGRKATLLARRAENDARKTGEREEKGEEEIRAKRQRPTACNRMATLRTPFVFAAPGKVGANSLDNAGRNPMATKELVGAPKVVGLGPGGPGPGHVVRAGPRTGVDPRGGPGRGGAAGGIPGRT